MSKVAHIEKKFVDYEFIENRLLRLQVPYGPVQVVPNTRIYFGPNQTLKGKRLVALSVFSRLSSAGLDPSYNGLLIISKPIELVFWLITLVNRDGEEIIHNYPISDLIAAFNAGKIRIFDIPDLDIEASYLTFTDPAVLINFPAGIFFEFYTVSW